MRGTGPADPLRTWFRRRRSTVEAGTRVVLFPHAGGSASFFAPWHGTLTSSVDLLVVQYPGHEDRIREAPAESLVGLADAVAEVMRPLADRPLVLFGHSMGAALAYEVVRRLESRGLPVRLFASGSHAPHRRRRGHLHLLDNTELTTELRRLGGTATAVLDDADIRDVVLPTLRADYRLIETYRHEPGPALRCPVTVYLGDGDPDVGVEDASAWADLTEEAFDIKVFEGDHFYLVDRRDEVVADLQERLRTPAWPQRSSSV